MTESLYPTDAYLRTFAAVVTAHDAAAHAVILDRSAFYPGGGGQPADQGQLAADDRVWPVLRAKRAGADILHLLPPDQELPPIGTAVTGSLDWARRFALMRTHTALHVLCGVVFRDYGALVTGGDMEPLQGRMDFEFETMQKELVQTIEERVNAEIAQGYPVEVRILPRAEAFAIPDLIRTKINLLPEGISEVRTVSIVGLDLQADGGTHVANTREIGRIRITDYKSKGKINKRLYLTVEDA
jgi:misacylated tRNA(Ala) deacylase